MKALNTDYIVTHKLLQINQELASAMDGDCVFINSAIIPPLDDILRDEFEFLKQADSGHSSQEHLAVVVQTTGGYMETVERIVAAMRTHYNQVSFIIPNFAFSAGTVLALSGDDIYMDYYSVLGPIDPQYIGQDGNTQSGYGVLAKFRELCEKINDADDAESCRAELSYLIKNFDPGQLFQFEQAVEHGKTLITEWLPKYKFKDWKKSKSLGKTITEEDKKMRAGEIADVLGDASRWHSHGRGISMETLLGDDIRLKINDFGQNTTLNPLICNYHGLAVDYYGKLGQRGYIHSKLGNKRIS